MKNFDFETVSLAGIIGIIIVTLLNFLLHILFPNSLSFLSMIAIYVSELLGLVIIIPLSFQLSNFIKPHLQKNKWYKEKSEITVNQMKKSGFSNLIEAIITFQFLRGIGVIYLLALGLLILVVIKVFT